MTSASILRLSRLLPLLLTSTTVLVSPGCQKSEPEPSSVDYFSWTNPITGAVVELPEGWRQSPETTIEGETTIGYFKPNFAMMLGRYGHVTLHYEDMRRVSPPMTLEKFMGNFIDYMRDKADQLSEPVFEKRSGFKMARVSVEIVHRDRQLLLKARFWTDNDRDFWYAVIESLVEDGEFAQRAVPLLEKLQTSTEM